MTFLLDENISFDAIGFLERLGYKTEHVKLLGKSGIRNGEVHKLAVSKQAWIITRDTDFMDREKITKHKTKGVIVINLTDSTTNHLLKRLRHFFSLHKVQLKKKKLIVIEDKRFLFFK